MNIPTDPIILLGFLNTKLRDFYPSFEELCKSLDLDGSALTETLAQAGYAYDPTVNQFR